MYNHILVPLALDDSHDSSHAIRLAESLLAPDGQITLLHVAEQIPTYVASQIPKEVLEDGHKTMVSRLETAAGSVSKTASAHVIHGPAGQAIVEYAEAHGADCIIVHSHKPGLSDYLLGSTAARVVRHAPCSVHVIR